MRACRPPVLLALLTAAPAVAAAPDAGRPVMVGLTQVDHSRSLAPKAERDSRWLLPEIDERDEDQARPMIRWRLNKVKVRVPFG